ncbi:guanine nucleotide exchange factor for Rab-3A-like [Watersipora subatra]|uniref:guanine nucleotide exchange factor for Rab-3A-like n=1 Tax=Watersipora subatra TaxID=2589382 RepID=UPI00355C124B
MSSLTGTSSKFNARLTDCHTIPEEINCKRLVLHQSISSSSGLSRSLPESSLTQHHPLSETIKQTNSQLNQAHGYDEISSKESFNLCSSESDLSDCDSGFSGSNRDGLGPEQWDLRRRSTSMVEAKDQTYRKLKEELMRAQGELQLKDQECGKLERVRDQMEQELEELTASLFEEANKMVQDANVKRMHTEKLLKEAESSIEVLNAEVQALKALVLTSTPSEPNRHLHPQIDRAAKEAPAESSIAKKLSFKKTHKRSTSHHLTKAAPDFVFDATMPAPGPPTTRTLTDTESFECFKSWRENPTLSHDSIFVSRIMREDVIPGVSFANKELAARVLEQCETNNISIEPIPTSSQSNRNCALMQRNILCSYKIRFADSEPWLEICELVRNRIIAVCELFTYLGYVKNGLVKSSSDSEIYWHIMDLRKVISLARLGFKS